MIFIVLAINIAVVGVGGVSYEYSGVDPKNERACPPYERYVTCLLSHCEPQECRHADETVPCPGCGPGFLDPPGAGGCVCIQGHFRNEGRCVPRASCPNPICPANEYYASCARDHCRPKTCSDLGKTLNCSIFPESFCDVGGCVCKDYFVRNDKGECVPEGTCPIPQCPENEEYVSCPSGRCSSQQCIHIGMGNMPCGMISGYCPGGCFCKPGYLRHQGSCIPQETCPYACPSPNSNFTSCMPNCDYTECAQLRHPPYPYCVPIEPGSDFCRIGCVCRDGYLFDNYRHCVRREQCGESNSL